MKTGLLLSALLLGAVCQVATAMPGRSLFAASYTDPEYDIYTDTTKPDECRDDELDLFASCTTWKGYAGFCQYDMGGTIYCARAKAPAGPSGDEGAVGATGPEGKEGAKGETGSPGPKGDTGDKGPKGDTGDKGPKGDTGDRGPKGDTGDKGPPGLAGGCPGKSVERKVTKVYNGAGPISLQAACGANEVFMLGSCQVADSLDWNIQNQYGSAATKTQTCRFKRGASGNDAIDSKIFAVAHCCDTSSPLGTATIIAR